MSSSSIGLPKMEGNPYNLIAFQDEVYTKNAALSISPTPDTPAPGLHGLEGVGGAGEIPPQVLTSTPLHWVHRGGVGWGKKSSDRP